MIDERISCLDWQRQALCFPAEEASPWDADRLGEMASLAKEGCARCPVFDRCRERVDALEGKASSNSLSCVYAGETPGERVRRRRRASQRVVEDEASTEAASATVELVEESSEATVADEFCDQVPVEAEAATGPDAEDLAARLARVEQLLSDVVESLGAARVPAGFERPPVERCCLCNQPFAVFVADLDEGRPLHVAAGHCESCYRDYLALQKASRAAVSERIIEAA